MPRILIVDDSPTIRRMIRAALAGVATQVEFDEAASGLEALERLSLKPVGLMILDLNMPDMHGIEVLDFMRAHQRYVHVPIIVLTTRGDDAARESALAAGASAFMTKPFVPAVLAERAKSFLSDSVQAQARK